MIDIAKEKLISFARAAALFPGRGSDQADRATVWKWARRGRKGPGGKTVKLEFVRVAGRLCTSTAAVRRFIAATTRRPARVRQGAAHAS